MSPTVLKKQREITPAYECHESRFLFALVKNDREQALKRDRKRERKTPGKVARPNKTRKATQVLINEGRCRKNKGRLINGKPAAKTPSRLLFSCFLPSSSNIAATRAQRNFFVFHRLYPDKPNNHWECSRTNRSRSRSVSNQHALHNVIRSSQMLRNATRRYEGQAARN